MTDHSVVDLRSDTVTRPSPAMRQAMANAEVGDSQYGEDPTVNRLQDRVAEMLGKEAAVWFNSGTQSNQAALMTLTRPGDEAIISREAHAAWHEAGGSALNAGVQMVEVGDRGRFTAAEMVAAIKPSNLPVFPRTTLVEVENTHNRMGGIVLPQAEIEEICATARDHGMNTFLDGARLWNASAATGMDLAEMAAPFDLVTVAFSKGLGAPGGSMMAGPRELVEQADRYRRILGGAMRQIGILAAAALYGLDHNLDRLPEDHANARTLGETLAQSDKVILDLTSVQSNMVVFRLTDAAPPTDAIIDAARAQGVLIGALGPRLMRAVTHLDAPANGCVHAGEVLLAAIED